MEDPKVDAALGVVGNRSGLQALAFGCERLMEIAASVLVRIDSTREKLTLAREVWALAQSAHLIRQRLGTMRVAQVSAHPGSAAYVAVTNAMVSLQNPMTELAALVHIGYPDVRDAAMAHKMRVPSSADEATMDCLEGVLNKLDVLRFGEGSIPHCLASLEARMASAGGVLGVVEPSRADDGLDQGVEESRVESLCALPMIPHRPGREFSFREAGRDDKVKGAGYGPALHDFAFRIELCATEICASMLAHHPEAPWGLRYDLAKQTRDEARHFELFAARVRQLGLELGELPLLFEVWDKFAVGESLAQRLIIEQRIGEGAALDSAEQVYRRLKSDGEDEVALAFEYVTADEVAHVASGNKWLRYLLGSDDEITRVEDEVRRRLELSGLAPANKHPINVDDRTLSGFTPAELIRLEQLREDEAANSG